LLTISLATAAASQSGGRDQADDGRASLDEGSGRVGPGDAALRPHVATTLDPQAAAPADVPVCLIRPLLNGPAPNPSVPGRAARNPE
jgi:hypothetical protein